MFIFLLIAIKLLFTLIFTSFNINFFKFFIYNRNITLNFAECPPLLEKNRPLTDKEMLFFDHEKFIKEKVAQYNPSHIVILSEFYNNDFINQFLVEKNYIKVKNILKINKLNLKNTGNIDISLLFHKYPIRSILEFEFHNFI